MSGSTNNLIQVKLNYAITVDGVQVDKLSLRRPKVRDMLGVETSHSNDAQKEIHLFAHLCEVSPDCLMDLDMADYSKLQTVYQGFLS